MMRPATLPQSRNQIRTTPIPARSDSGVPAFKLQDIRAEVRMLSVRQPWAHLIVTGIKRIENRTWSTRWRGPVLVHAALRPADTPTQQIERKFGGAIPRDLPRGGVVGIAGLADVIDT